MPAITVDITPDGLAAALDQEPGDLFRVLAELAALPDDFPAPSFEEAFGEAHTGDAASRRVLPFLRRLVARIKWVEGAPTPAPNPGAYQGSCASEETQDCSPRRSHWLCEADGPNGRYLFAAPGSSAEAVAARDGGTIPGLVVLGKVEKLAHFLNGGLAW